MLYFILYTLCACVNKTEIAYHKWIFFGKKKDTGREAAGMEDRKSSGEKLQFWCRTPGSLVTYWSNEGSGTWTTHLCLTSLVELYIFNVIQSEEKAFCEGWIHSVPKVLLDCSAVSHSGSEFGGLRRTTHEQLTSREGTCTGLEHPIFQEIRNGSQYITQEGCQRG